MDTLTVKVEIRQDLAEASASIREACAAKLAHEIKAYVGVTARVEVAPPHDVERSLGKAKRVLDLRS